VIETFVLDASFALHWCFEDEATDGTDSVLTALQDQRSTGWVPGIWAHEVLNGLGKGVIRGRMARQQALLFWEEIRALPVRMVNDPADRELLELALAHNLAIYDACYLSLAISRNLPIATGDLKLQQAALRCGIDFIKP
jgi:predicted nucleic acid-binding protein